MPRAIDCACAIALLLLLDVAASAMVLPRPPSSPNHIRQESQSARKAHRAKSLHGASRYTDDDYRLLEIELRSTDEMDAANLQGVVRAMLKQQQQPMPNEASYPKAEVVPRSIVGVRDMGLSSNYRGHVDTFDDKRVLLSPPKLQSLDEKLYYLKSGRPKVYVNVRGRSGSFGRRVTVSSPAATSSDGALGYLKVTRPFDRQTDRRKARDKKARPPKKFDRRVDFDRARNGTMANGSLNDQATSYRTTDHPSTTENSMVTSSELPKQIPAPPSKVRGRVLVAQTTPVQRYALRRTDILPGYGFSEE